ncbi:hypothetical protein BCV70DRAFT_109253 [Testicularia cyperi]|uniref:NAD-specific glutamate dehydrogenase n=1 Tax=Testicularia cyperi TaxID=1882483 RepID=A0A317XRB7_9BASI|nr:hypothetical protein BCV70DRAFT_109253 [Testicularia cyperi]
MYNGGCLRMSDTTSHFEMFYSRRDDDRSDRGVTCLVLEEEVLTSGLLLLVLDRVELVDTWTVVGGVTTHRHFKGRKEAVHTGEERLGALGGSLDGRLALVNNDAVGEVGGHDDVVLDDHGGLARVNDESLDDARGDDTLLRVEVGRGLVDQVDVGRLAEREHQRDSLQLTTREGLDVVVDDGIERHGLDDIGLELRVHEGGLDLLEQQHAHSALELGRNGLRLERHVELRRLLGTGIGLELSGEHLDEGGLTGTVLAEDLERERLLTESHVLCGNITVEEDVDAIANGRGHGNDTVDRRHTVETADEIGEVVEHRQIVFDGNDVSVGVEERADHSGGIETLLDIEIRRGLVEHVDVGILNARHADGKALQLTTREVLNITVEHLLEVELVDDLLFVVTLELAIEELGDRGLALDGTRNVVDVLRLDESLDVVLEHFGEEILQLGSTEVLEDLLPVGRVIVTTQVGLLLSCENLERGRLADTVGTNQT